MPEDSKRKIEKFMRPVKALIVHEHVSPSGSEWSYTGRFITVHDIHRGAITEGRPLTREALRALCLAAMPETSRVVSFLPDNVLAYTPHDQQGMLAWWTPPQVRKFFFDRSTGIPSGPAPAPALLFVVNGDDMRLFALNGSSRPTPDTPLFWPPFYNCHSNGSVCLGNMKIPKLSTPETIGKWEHAFWKSAFTSEGPPVLKGTDGKKLWKELVNSGINEFPVKYLVPARMKAAEAIKR